MTGAPPPHDGTAEPTGAGGGPQEEGIAKWRADAAPDAPAAPGARAAKGTWRDGGLWRRIALTYAIAGVAGWCASLIAMPLPYMLGPFFVCGALSVAGVPLAFAPMGREFAQLTVGLAIGLRFTPATLAATLSLLPAMIAATAFVIAYTFLAAFLLRPLAKVDAVTAFFATAAGGVADMAIVARERGGDAAPVAIVHALRVSATVAIVPIIVVGFGTPGTQSPAGTADASALAWLVLAAALSVASVYALRPTGLPNPWLVGPIFVGIGLGASGVLTLQMPAVVIILAQVALGTWLGCRFKREILTSIPRVAAAGLAISVFMIACAGAGAWVMSLLTPLTMANAFLALAPAAVTEMAITAKAMHLDAEIVTAFHVMRIAIVCSTVIGVYKLYCALKGGPRGSRI